MPKQIVVRNDAPSLGVFRTNGYQSQAAQTGPQAQLVIVLGGSGTQVGQQIINDPHLSQHLDLSVGFIDGDREGKADLPADTYYSLDDVPAHDLIKEIKRNPDAYVGCKQYGDIEETVGQSLPAGTDDLSGAPDGQRNVVKFEYDAHWWRNQPEMTAFYLGLARRVLRIPPEGAPGRNQQVLLNTSIAASICGGTGSALALLVRDIFKQLVRNQLGVSRIEFQLHLLLPGAFYGRAGEMQALMAKTYAVILELLARYEQSFPPVRLGTLQYERDRDPFTWIYVYDTINQHDRLLDGQEQVTEVIKAVWETINFGPMAERYRARLEHMRSKAPSHFSAAGITGLEYPVARLKRQGAYRTGLTVLHTLLEPNPDIEQQGRQLFEDFLRQHPEFNTSLDLRLDVAGKPLTVSYHQFAASLKHVPRQQLLTAIDQVTTQLLADLLPRQAEARQQETARRERLVAAAMQEALDQPYGLQLAHHFLLNLDRQQAELQLNLSRQIERTKEELAAFQQQPRTSGPGRLAKLTLHVRPAHLQSGYHLLSQRLVQGRHSRQYQDLHQRREQLKSYRSTVASMTETLLEFSQRFQAAETAYLQQQRAKRSVVYQSLLTEEQINQLVNDRVTDILPAILAGISFNYDAEDNSMILQYAKENPEFKSVPILSAEGLQRHLNYCQQFWDHLDRECSVEGHLRAENVDLGELIAALERRATPWVAVNRARQMPAEKRLLILGTETGAEFVGDALNHINVVATGDKTRLVLLYTIHGLDVMNLEQAPAWQDAYEQAIARGERLHVVPEVDPLNPANNKKQHGRRSKNGRKNARK